VLENNSGYGSFGAFVTDRDDGALHPELDPEGSKETGRGRGRSLADPPPAEATRARLRWQGLRLAGPVPQTWVWPVRSPRITLIDVSNQPGAVHLPGRGWVSTSGGMPGGPAGFKRLSPDRG
jgi:hypothetical protein